MTRGEYNRIQELLGRKGNPRPISKQDIAYRGPIKCGECGAMITAEEKTKYQKNGNVHHYTYYHCTKRKDPNCAQLSIEERELEKQIARELAKIEIPTDFKDWAVTRLKEMNSKEIEDRESIYGAQRREYEACVRKIDNLIDMRANGEITEDEFLTRKKTLLAEKARFHELLNDIDKRVENWLEIAERGFNYAEKAASLFAEAKENENLKVKKEVFAALGSNLFLKDKKLCISKDNLIFPLQNVAKEARAVKARLEPPKSIEKAGHLGEIYSQNPSLLRVLDDVRTSILQGKSLVFSTAL
jgi:predicted metal-binding protein